MRDFTTRRTQQANTSQGSGRRRQFPVGQCLAEPPRLFAFSGLVFEDGETVRHFVGYKAAADIDQAYREAMAECYRQFPVVHGYDCHSVEIVEIPGISFAEVQR